MLKLATDMLASRPSRVVANLPYQITTPVLERLLAERVALSWLVAGYSAAAIAGAPGRGLSPAQLGQLQGRQERTHRAFLAASKGPH